MWTGGVRVLVLDDEQRMLLVRQHHDNKDIWMPPGGNIEEDESAADAAVREVREETALDIEIKGLLWHVEEVSERGQRFVNCFLAKPLGGSDEVRLGHDPELGEDGQVLQEVRFMSRQEMVDLEHLYPAFLRDEFWQLLEEGKLEYDAFRMREFQTYQGGK